MLDKILLQRNWNELYDIIVMELGVECLVEEEKSYYEINNRRDEKFYKNQCQGFLKSESTKYENVLDIIEAVFNIVEDYYEKYYPNKEQRNLVIEELNHRFRENSVGYEYVNRKIIRVDRRIVHNEIIKPAIRLLYEEEFRGASDEFMKAHEYYKKEEYKDAILYAGKAFESTMKTICENLKFEYKKDKDTANRLIKILCDNDLIPASLKNHFDGVDKIIDGTKNSLECGLPVIRNKTSGHGQGNEVIKIPESLVTYALNLAATNIVLLVNLYKENK